MKILDDEKGIDICTAKFKNLIEDETNISDLFELLDEITHEYSKYIMRDNNISGGSNIHANRVTWLKILRDIFIETK